MDGTEKEKVCQSGNGAAESLDAIRATGGTRL